MEKTNKYVAIQEGCDNRIYSYKDSKYKYFFDTIVEARSAVKVAAKDESHGCDWDMGDIVIYNVRPVERAKLKVTVFEKIIRTVKKITLRKRR